MGRPTNNPRTEKITFRLSKNETDLIQECADKMSVKRIDVVIEGVKLVKEKLDNKAKE